MNHHHIQSNKALIHSATGIKLITASICAVLVSACHSVPKSNSALVIAEPNLAIDQPYTTLDKATVSTDKVPNIAIQRWQLFYSDPKLRALIQLALENNKDLASALTAIKKSKAQYQISDNNTRPNLAGSANYSRSATHAIDKNPANNYNVALAMPSYELDLWGRLATLKGQALQNYLATTAGKDSAQIMLISNLAQTYVNLSYAKAQYELAKSTVESRKHSLFITQKRFEVGVDAKTPSLQAAASLESAKVAMYNAETAIIKLNNALQLLVGKPVPLELLPDAGITKISNQRIFNAGLPSDLLHYRPDILQAEYQLKATGANIEVARLAYFPSISLTGRLGVSSLQLNDLFKSSSVAWSFAPSVSVPIFDAGQLDANYQVAKIQQEQALLNYEKKIQTAFKEVADVLADRATLQKRLESQYKLQDNFNETYHIANEVFKSGLSDYLGVLDAERSKFYAQQEILQLEQANLISQIRLYQVLGGGVAMDVPVELAVPNHPDLVKFINDNKTDADIAYKNLTVISSNVARAGSNSRLATAEDYETTKKAFNKQERSKQKGNTQESNEQKGGKDVKPANKTGKQPIKSNADTSKTTAEQSVVIKQEPNVVKTEVAKVEKSPAKTVKTDIAKETEQQSTNEVQAKTEQTNGKKDKQQPLDKVSPEPQSTQSQGKKQNKKSADKPKGKPESNKPEPKKPVTQALKNNQVKGKQVTNKTVKQIKAKQFQSVEVINPILKQKQVVENTLTIQNTFKWITPTLELPQPEIEDRSQGNRKDK